MKPKQLAVILGAFALGYVIGARHARIYESLTAGQQSE
jgi:hypothetical protein